MISIGDFHRLQRLRVFYHQPFLTLILSQHLMVILREFSYYDNFNDNSMINLTHRKGLFLFSFFGTSLINSYKSSRTKYDPSSHIFKQKIGTELFYNVLNPAHVFINSFNKWTISFLFHRLFLVYNLQECVLIRIHV